MAAINSSPVVQTLGLVLVHFLWQGAVVALATAAALALCRQATTRYAVALAGLMGLAMAPLATGAWLWDRAPVAVLADPASTLVPAADGWVLAGTLDGVARAALETWSVGLTPWLPLVVGVWLAGVLILSTRLAYGWLVIARLRRHAITTIAAPLAAAVARVQHAMGLRQPMAVAESSLVDTPTVIGWLRPLLLMPVGVVAGLSPTQLDAIVAHELAHVRRLDPFVNGLQALLETVLFYHPAVWWISGVLRREREFSSDDAAVAVVGDRVAYATALAALEESRRSPTFALAASDGELLTRVQRILGVPMKRPSPAFGLAFLGVMAVVSATAMAGMSTPTTPASQVLQGANWRLGDALDRAREELTGLPAAGLIVVSDGADSARAPQLLAAQTQVMNADAALRNAIQTRSTTALEGLLADAFLGTDQNGIVDSRASLLARMAHEAPARIDLRQITMQVADGMAIVTGVQIETKGTTREQVVFTRVWDRSGSRPLLVSSTQFRDPRPAATPGAAAAGPGTPGRTAGGVRNVEVPAAGQTGDARVPVRIGGAFQAPTKILDAAPIYPQIAKAAQVQGVVVAEIEINPAGVPTGITVLRGHPMLNPAAVDAIFQWRYQPTLLNGVPVSAIATVTVQFSLAGSAAPGAATQPIRPNELASVAASPIGQAPIRVGGDIKEPRKIKNVPPVYPQTAKDAGISGVVILEALLDEAGRVTDMHVLRGVPLLDEAAMEAVRQWEYTPTTMNGVPVHVIMTITVNFQLN